MKRNTLRAAAVAAVGGLLMAAATPLTAFAVSTPTYDNTTDAPIYLMDGTTATQIASGTQLDWNYTNTIVLTANPVPADLGDMSWAPFPATAGGNYIAFLTAPGSERTPTVWKQWSSFGGDTSSGVLLPSVYPSYLSQGAPAATKAAGGTYSMGIAITDGTVLSNMHVTKAYYTTISVEAGTGTWTFAAPPVACTTVNTDITTATSLVADKTSVEQGGTALLTASVSASKALPDSNVEFFQGTTSLGTVGLASGSASKTVTVGALGANTYSAKYVENVVETAACPAKTTDTFKASTSADVTVTATAATVPPPPNGPTESALNASTANGATAAYDTATKSATLSNIPAASEGKPVNVFAYSADLKYLGTKTVTGGSVTVDVSTLAAGVHKLAVTDPTTGDVIAWASFTKSDAASAPTISKTINADVAALTPADGEFSLTNLSGAVVNLTNPALVNGASVVSGELGKFKVTDLRQVSKPGWTLKTDVAQFVKGSDTIENSALGIAPKAVNQAGTGATTPTLGTATVSGSATYPWNFATLASTKFSGVSTYNADLVFTAPSGKPAGTYTSTLTLTLVSN